MIRIIESQGDPIDERREFIRNRVAMLRELAGAFAEISEDRYTVDEDRAAAGRLLADLEESR